MTRPSRIEVSASALRSNVEALVELCAPAAVCAVVKANAYGHGAVLASREALAGGASVLAVALVEEAVELREAGIDAPILVLSAPQRDDWATVAELGLESFVYSRDDIEAAAAAAGAGSVGGARGEVEVGLHLKVDTGMRRVGCEVGDALELAGLILDTPGVRLAGLATHLATADEVAPSAGAALCDAQLAAFSEVDAQVAAMVEGRSGSATDRSTNGDRGYVRHVANSPAALTRPQARLDMVRCGIAVYGIAPSPAQPIPVELTPAARLVSAVTWTKRVGADEAVSYGARYRTPRETTIATVPVGYADGVARSLTGAGAEVLINGRRAPIVGTVTMDQLMIDVGDEPVAIGDEVVLIGRAGADEITANDLAETIGTIGYEVVTRLSARLPRVVVP